MYEAAVLVVAALAAGVRGHGRLLEPPSRASAWRLGLDTPINYNDNQLFCGGRYVGLYSSILKLIARIQKCHILLKSKAKCV